MAFRRLLPCLALCFKTGVEGRLSDYVDLLIGTEGPIPGSGIASGNVFPGAALPNGMAKVGIDTSYTGFEEVGTDVNAGYSPLGNVTGISMMHVTGTGGDPMYGLVSQMPLTGTLASFNLANNLTYAQNRSLASETAAVGHFSTTLLDGVQIDITASNHTGIIRYTFPTVASAGNGSLTSGLGAESALHSMPSASDAHILVDLTHVLPAQNPRTMTYSQQFLRGELHVRTGSSGQASYSGSATYTGGWPNPEEHRYFFCSNFSVPASSVLTPSNAYVPVVGFDRVDGAGTFSWQYNAFEPATTKPLLRSDTDVYSAAGNRMGVGALFSWTRGTAVVGNSTAMIEARVGVSHTSVAKACVYIEDEVPAARGFDDIIEQARQEWESKVLNAVEIVEDNSTTSQNLTLKRMLYTALYQTSLMPTDKTFENPYWTSNETFPYYDDHYTLWDTYRTLLPIYHLLFTSTYARVIKGLINIYTFEGYLPAGRAANWNGRVQGGTHADLVLADAYVKAVNTPTSATPGLGELGDDIDWTEAFAAMVKNAEVLPARNADSQAFDGATKEGRGALDDYLRLKYITRNHSRSISRGLEYPQDDYGLWAVARGVASESVQNRYLDRAGWWENQWNAAANTTLYLTSSNGTDTHETFTGFAGPRNVDGNFNFTNYDPLRCLPGCEWSDDIYEARVWETSFSAAPHDMSRVIALMGGDEAFLRRLDTSFVPGLSVGTGEANNDAGTTLFNPGNEPSFPMPYLYNYVPGYHWKTANQTRATVDEYYSDQRNGYPGNTDAGALPSWLIFNLLGFYPITGQAIYLLGAPRFSSAKVRLFAGTALERTLAIRADGVAHDVYYPQRVLLDGVELNRAWLSHSELVGAKELVFEMGSQPARWDIGERPWSLSGWS